MSRMTPGDVPRGGGVQVVTQDELDGQAVAASEVVLENMTAKLEELREPFPPEMIEKLPKPMWKGAWEGKRGAHCNICHGYHVLDDCIHLDYVGHANTTNRLLKVDPFWDWEPMSLTEAGTPHFSDGGLWIRLTVCGVTRLGFGDGKNPKEIIGDAIRNAAMRFGVALDLWSKIDLHAERNPGDGPTPPERGQQAGGRSQARGEGTGAVSAPAPTRAANQDALDELMGVCNTHGLDPRAVEARYNDTLAPPQLVQASPDDIRNYAAILISECEPEPEGVDASGRGDTADEAQSVPEVHAGVAESVPADPSGSDPEDTSDVEKQPGDLF